MSHSIHPRKKEFNTDWIRERINFHWKRDDYILDDDENDENDEGVDNPEWEEHEWAYGPDVPFEPTTKRYWFKDGEQCFLIRKDEKHMTYTWEPREYHT